MNGWEWRIGDRISVIASDRFHAYDGDDKAACRPFMGLVQSVKEVDEGSDLCPECMAVVQAGSPEYPAAQRGAAPEYRVPQYAASATRADGFTTARKEQP